jgi:hypothetical protein
VVVHPANALAHLARRHRQRRLPILTRPNALVEVTRRIAPVRLESALAAAVPNKFLPLGQRQGVDVRLLDFADMARALLSASTPSAHDAATASTGIVDSANIAPLEPEKKSYA